MHTTAPKIPPWASALFPNVQKTTPTPHWSYPWTYLQLITTPTSTKCVQKLTDHIRWAHKKADLFQQKEAWCHKWNYDKCSKAVSLRIGDMALVCVTAFKGRHKIQSRWKNREYVAEWQAYPNLPTCVVCPTDGEEHGCTLHWNYLLPISHNLEQETCEDSAEGVGPANRPTPVPHEEDALPVNCLTESWPEGIPNSLSKPCELVNPVNPALTNPNPTNDRLQANDDMPALLRWSSRTTRNQPP